MVAQTVTKGTAPSWTRWASPATNRLAEFGYDATGNVTWMPNPSGHQYADREAAMGGPGKYHRYGQERQTTPQDTEKFATYYRDSTGLDYAWNRYYRSSWGRFLQADPYLSPDALKNPQGWNRYAYVVGDPVNYYDPSGLDYLIVINVFTRYYDVNAIWDAERSYWDGVWGAGGGLSGMDSWRPSGTEGRGGGAAAVGYKIEVLELSKSGREQEVILPRLREILDRIDEDCARWLEGYEPYVRGLLGEGLEEPLIAHGVFKDKPLVAAISSTVHTNVDAGEAAIVINRAGAFFNAAIGGQKVLVGGGRYTGGIAGGTSLHIAPRDCARVG